MQVFIREFVEKFQGKHQEIGYTVTSARFAEKIIGKLPKVSSEKIQGNSCKIF